MYEKVEMSLQYVFYKLQKIKQWDISARDLLVETLIKELRSDPDSSSLESTEISFHL